MKSSTRLCVTGDVRVERLTLWSDPVDYGAFHSFSIIGPRTVDAFLNLWKCSDAWSFHITARLTNSAMEITSSSEEDISRSSREGTSFSNCRNVANSFLSLWRISGAPNCSYERCLWLRKGLYFSVAQFAHHDNAISQQSLNATEGMNSASKVASMVHQRVLGTSVVQSVSRRE